MEAGYSPQTCKDLVCTPEKASGDMLPLVTLNDAQKQATPSMKLGAQWKKKKLGIFESVQKPLFAETLGYQKVGVNVSFSKGFAENKVQIDLPMIGEVLDVFQR